MKTFKACFLILIACFIGQFPATAQVFEWAHSFVGASANLAGHNTATDAVGNTYLLGSFTGEMRVNGDTLSASSSTDTDLFVAKYSAQGNLIWITQAVGQYEEHAASLAIDPAGNVFVTGFHAGVFTFGTHTLAQHGFFLAKITSAGTVQWLHHLATASEIGLNSPAMEITDLDVDAAGNGYLSGLTMGVGHLGGLAMDSTILNYTGFLAKFNAAGTFQWVNQTVAGIPLAATVDGYGNIFQAGTFSDSVSFGISPTLVSLSYPDSTSDMYLVKFSPYGNALWAQMGIGAGLQYSTDVVADGLGNCYVTGHTDGPANFGQYAALKGGMLLVKYDGAGNVLWVRQQASPATDVFSSNLAVDATGNVYLSGGYLQPLTFGSTTLPARGMYDIFIASYDSQGALRWAESGGGAGDEWTLGLGLDNMGGLYFCTLLSSGSGNAPTGEFGQEAVTGAGLALVKMSTDNSSISGTIYIDQNGNGQRDPGEPPYTQPVVLINALQQQLISSNANGRYRGFVSTGSYLLTMPQVPDYYTLSEPASGNYTGYFNTSGLADLDRDFGLVPTPGQQDLKVFLTPVNAARPGFTTTYRVTLKNAGTVPVPSGTVSLTFDQNLNYLGSTPSVAVTGNTITWNFSNLQPSESRNLEALFSLPTNIPLGTQLSSTAQASPVSGDVTPNNNTETALQTVTGSFDPNDKLVSQAVMTTAEIQAGESLDYTIRFQNLGTDTAFTVIIKDTISIQHLDASAIQFVAASHSCTWSVSGANVLNIRFNHINLPYRDINVVRSRGFVRFSLKPQPTLAEGVIIPNHARIIFDFNAPVVTNTATTLVSNTTGLAEAQNTNAFQVYPNPVNSMVRLSADLGKAGTVEVRVVNALGELMYSASRTSEGAEYRTSVDLGRFPAGLYLLQLHTDSGILTRTVVKE